MRATPIPWRDLKRVRRGCAHPNRYSVILLYVSGRRYTRFLCLLLSMFLLGRSPLSSLRFLRARRSGPSYLPSDISFQSAELLRLFVLRHTLTRPRGFFILLPVSQSTLFSILTRPFHLHCVSKSERTGTRRRRTSDCETNSTPSKLCPPDEVEFRF